MVIFKARCETLLGAAVAATTPLLVAQNIAAAYLSKKRFHKSSQINSNNWQSRNVANFQ
jgi:hypothetical protein